MESNPTRYYRPSGAVPILGTILMQLFGAAAAFVLGFVYALADFYSPSVWLTALPCRFWGGRRFCRADWGQNRQSPQPGIYHSLGRGDRNAGRCIWPGCFTSICSFAAKHSGCWIWSPGDIHAIMKIVCGQRDLVIEILDADGLGAVCVLDCRGAVCRAVVRGGGGIGRDAVLRLLRRVDEKAKERGELCPDGSRTPEDRTGRGTLRSSRQTPRPAGPSEELPESDRPFLPAVRRFGLFDDFACPVGGGRRRQRKPPTKPRWSNSCGCRTIWWSICTNWAERPAQPARGGIQRRKMRSIDLSVPRRAKGIDR